MIINSFILGGAAAANIQYVNSAFGGYSAGASASIAAAAASLTTGNFIVVAVRWAVSSNSVSSVTDTAGNTYARAGGITSTTDDLVDVWYAMNVTGHASNVVTANFSGTPSARCILTSQYSGIKTTSALDATASGTGSGGTITSGTFTTAQADELIIAAAQVAATGTAWTAGSGYTKQVEDGSTVSAMEDKIVSSIQTGVTAEFTNNDTTNSKCIFVATFKAA